MLPQWHTSSMRIGAINRILHAETKALALAVLTGSLIFAISQIASAEIHKTERTADELFTNGLVPRLHIEIPLQGIAQLQSYEWDRKSNGKDRSKVLATVREGDNLYTNVANTLERSFPLLLRSHS